MGDYKLGWIVSVIIGLLLFLTALVSGGIYPTVKVIFTVSAVLLSFIVINSRSWHALKGVWPAFLLAGVSCLSVSWAVYPNGAVMQSWSLAPYALFAFAVAYAAVGDSRVRLLETVFFAAALVSAYAVYQYFIGLEHAEQFLREAGEASGLTGEQIASAEMTLQYRRAFSTLLSPNVLGCYLAMVFPVGLGLYDTAGSKRKKALYALILTALFTALILTKSVSGFLAFLTGSGAYIALRISSGDARMTGRRAIVILSVLMVFGVAGWGVLKMRTGGVLGFERSYTEKLGYWSAAAEIWKEAPLTGFGAGSFDVMYPAHMTPGTGETRYAHNVFLQTLAETGVIGLAALLIVFAVFFTKSARRWRGGGGPGLIFAGVLGGGAAFLAGNLFDYNYYVPETAILFWFYFGIAASGEKDGAPEEDKPRLPLRLAFMTLLCVFGLFYVRGYMADRKATEAAEIMQGTPKQATYPEWKSRIYKAGRLARDAAWLKPYDDRVHVLLAVIYASIAPTEGPSYNLKAEAQYIEAIRLNPQYPFHYRDLGLFYLKMGDKARAKEQFDKALERYPSNKVIEKLRSSSDS